MTPPKRYIHEDIGEENLWIDLSILTFLREEMLLGNLDYVSLRESHKQGLFSSDVDCSWERFRRRALYQVGLGFAVPQIIYGPEGEKIDSKKHTGHLCALRITPFGFMQISELEKEIKKYEGFNRYITKIKAWSERIVGMKGGIVVGTTTFLIICIFAFNIKVSAIVQKIPILSSIIDTSILKEFEAINTNDEFYQAMMSDSGTPSSGLTNAAGNREYESTTVPVSEIAAKLVPKNIVIPKAIQNILPEKAKIEDMTVQNISPTEKLFKITLDTGVTRYVQVKRESENYIIEGR
ncbi:MAG: hypothetical protein PHN60_02895 [Candidatus Gracilibacteria bacterium]|nr:hypothetical protein [Candidatus Gracilibacteria bacterium]